MQVTHRGFQLRVAHCHLDDAWVLALIEAMSGIAMSKLVRLYVSVNLPAGLPDGELHVGLVDSVSDDGTRAGMAASGVAWNGCLCRLPGAG